MESGVLDISFFWAFDIVCRGFRTSANAAATIRRDAMSAAPITTTPPPFAPAKASDYNRLDLDFRRPIPRPKVRGIVVDFHTHLLAARHAKPWFEAADHYGIDCFL